MNRNSLKNNSTSLTIQIKKAIGYRVSICFILATIVVFLIAVNDIIINVHQLEKNLEDQCSRLEGFVISQVLAENEEAIQPKLDSLNQNFKFIWSKQKTIDATRTFRWHFPFLWVYTYPVKYIDGTQLGTFIITGSFLSDKNLFSDLLTKISLLLLTFIIIFIMLYPLGKRIPQQLFIIPINNILLLLRNEKNKPHLDSLPVVTEEINEIRDKITALLKDAEERSREAALGQIATQVAHDIRSPLAVLNIETENLPSIPEKNRIDIRNAIQRVNDIANNLLSTYKQEKNKDETTTTTVLISEPATIMLESIVSEKRIQISNTEIDIKLEVNQEAYDTFIKVDTVDFKRALSNIINNAIEAVDKQGTITVKLSKKAGKVFIDIIDNGRGIPQDKLPLIFEEGISFGKKQGLGLGLPYAVNKITSWHGDYSLTSEPGSGTQFEIILPEARAAEWSAKEIHVAKGGTVVVLDDDEYIHKTWNNRFSNELGKMNDFQLIHFCTPKELIAYCEKDEKIGNTIFLLDYELIGHEQNGLELAEKLNIASKATLVTSRYEDVAIRETCKKLGMKIIPKLFANFIPIKFISNVDLILIDDDEIITRIWEDRAKIMGKKIVAFNDIHEFMQIFNSYDKNTLIYIDSALGGNLKGEEFAKTLYENGYQNIFIATGYDKKDFREVYWVKDIVDKSPPF